MHSRKQWKVSIYAEAMFSLEKKRSTYKNKLFILNKDFSKVQKSFAYCLTLTDIFVKMYINKYKIARNIWILLPPNLF